MSHLAENLRVLLSNAQISERELARRTGVPQPVIHRILNSQTLNPTIDTLKKLATYFVTNVSELTGEMQHELTTAPPANIHHPVEQSIPAMSQQQIFEYLKTNLIPRIFTYQMPDESMSPVFIKGDTLILDTSKTAIRPGSFVMLTQQNKLLIREVTTHKKEVYLQSYQPLELIQHKPDSDHIVAAITQLRRNFRA